MADPGSIDDFLSSEIDENAVNALVGSLETQLATPANTQASKTLTVSSYNNNHIAGSTSTASAVRPNFVNVNQTVTSNQKGSVSNNISVSTHVPVSASKISDGEILGISSIINTPSTPAGGVGVPHVNVNTSTGTSANGNVHRIPTPTIRIVTTQNSNPVASTNSAQFIPGGGVISQASLPTAVANNVHAVNVARTNVTPASNTIYNIATSIAEQKPMTVVHNGNAHAIQVAKDRAVISQQGIIVKQEGGTTFAIKQENMHPSQQQFIVKQEIKPDPGSGVSVPHSAALVNTTLKGVVASNPSIITVTGVRTQPHAQHVTVVQQPAVVTTQANMAQQMQVVNVSGVQGAPRLAGISPAVRPAQGLRVTAPVRITQQPSIAPRQGPPSSGTQHVTLPPGTVLVRNEQGQIMLMHTQQAAGASLHPSNVITTTTVPNTTSSALKIQRPTTPAALPRPAGGTIVIQPSSHPRGVPPTALTQPTATRVVAQPQPSIPAPSIAHPQPAVASSASMASGNELNKMMLENVKKCKNFLSTLLKLASNQPESTVKNVRALIQGLIDAKVEPENFTQKLQQELKSSPQPYLVPFLKKSLPMLRQLMYQNRMVIEGINAPPPSVVTSGTVHMAAPMAPRPQVVSQPPTVIRPVVTTQAMPKPSSALQGSVQRLTLSQSPAAQPVMQHKPLPLPAVAVASAAATSGGAVMASAAATMQNKPAVTGSPAFVPPLSQLGPLSSKALMQTPRTPPSAVRMSKGGGASAAVTAALQAHAAKLESSPVSHKEKRKFESLKEENDDINDVATMGGVNLSEESKNILATNSELIGSQIRSCQDKTFLPQDLLMSRVAAIAKRLGLEGVSPDVARIVSHATQERLRDLAARLSTIAEHRMDVYKVDPRYEQTSDVRGQLKFLEELGKVEQKRHEEEERELLLRAIKSRSKTEDPEQQKLKQKAKELQQMEAEEVRQREANLTALAAIGPRKKRKLDLGDPDTTPGSSNSSSVTNGPGTPSSRQPVIGRPRTKRVTLKDLQLLMEKDPHLCTSTLYYKTFLK